MATAKQYAIQLWQTHRTVSRKLGQDVSWGDAGVRTGTVATDVIIAGLIKILVDKGVITNAELTNMYDAIKNADFPQLPPMVAPDPDGAEVPPPDLGA